MQIGTRINDDTYGLLDLLLCLIKISLIDVAQVVRSCKRQQVPIDMVSILKTTRSGLWLTDGGIYVARDDTGRATGVSCGWCCEHLGIWHQDLLYGLHHRWRPMLRKGIQGDELIQIILGIEEY